MASLIFTCIYKKYVPDWGIYTERELKIWCLETSAWQIPNF